MWGIRSCEKVMVDESMMHEEGLGEEAECDVVREAASDVVVVVVVRGFMASTADF